MPIRLVIISTPRSGSTWLRQLLMDAYSIPGLAAHRPNDVDWPGLPPECVLQLHWHRTPALLRRLEEERFRVLTVARQPLDILISILQFCLHDDSTLQWLDGEGGSERSIQGAMPGSAAFLDYAVGPRAAVLMAVTHEWRQAADCLLVRYEELVGDTAAQLGRIAQALGEPVRRPIPEVVEGATIPKLRARTGVAHHFWQGRPGLWANFLVASVATRLAQTHHICCADMGYSFSPDPQLTPVQADANWLSLVWAKATEKLQKHRRQRLELSQAQDDLGRLKTDYSHLEQGYNELQGYCLSVEHAYRQLEATFQTACANYERLEAMLQTVRADQKRCPRLGPTSLALAQWLGSLAHRFPATASTVKRLLQRDKLPA
jgi:hypothetical protein